MTDMPIVWLDRFIDRALHERVSDIHFEFVDDYPPKLHPRVRINGVLRAWDGLEGPPAKAVVSRIKSIADVGSGTVRKSEEGRYLHRAGAGNIDEKLDQLEYEQESKKLERVDLRITALPTIRGEKYVLRLPSLSKIPRIPELGLSYHNLNLVAHLLAKPNGLFLFAGPVAVGKTTSMYSVLDFLRTDGTAVYSVEDPAERRLEGVDQIEINNAAENTFATALRSIRRSDLNLLMIGEIRDEETAVAALDISIAGSRVLSSIHANDSLSAITALQDMSGLSYARVLQALRGVISQRLVPRVHSICGGQGCDDCGGTGIDGRLAIHEVLPITPELTEAIVGGGHVSEQRELARKAGMVTLREDAQRRLDAGETTPQLLAMVLGNE